MFTESEEIGFQFEPDWERVFRRDFCRICKNGGNCPYNWRCRDMEIFIEENEEHHHVEDMDNDDTNNGDQ